MPSLGSVLPEFRQALRVLRHHPAFALAAVAAVGVGIGAITAMFSVLDAVILRALPVQHEQELVAIWREAPQRAPNHLPVAFDDLAALREGGRSVSDVAGILFQGALPLTMLDAGNPVVVKGAFATGNLFAVLGTHALHGRTLEPSDDVTGAEPTIVISHAFWQKQFAGDSSIVGHALAWNGKQLRIVGVIPPGLDYPASVDGWMAVAPAFPALRPSDEAFDLVARLRPAFSPRAASEELARILRAGDPQRDVARRGTVPVVRALHAFVTGEASSTLWAVTGGVVLLLLIACINVINLLLIRGAGRVQELAIRSALGARRRRLVLQLLVENGVLALVGGMVGVAIAVSVVPLLATFAPANLPRRELIALDYRALFFAMVVTALVAMGAGLVPALLSVGELTTWLRGGRSAVSGGRRGRAIRHALVVGQIALAMLVVTGAGLLTHSLIALQRADLGFNEERLLILETTLTDGAAPDHATQLAVHDAMLARVAALPGVLSAGAMPKPPFSGLAGWFASYTGDGQSAEGQQRNPWLNFEVVDPGYFRTLEMPIVRGRAFSDADREHSPSVAIVSDAVARGTWPGDDPLGKRIKLGGPNDANEWSTVVGVVGETRYTNLREPQPTLYLPLRQFRGPIPMTLAVRARTEPSSLVPQIRQTMHEVNPALVVVGGGTMRQLVAAPLAQPRFVAFVLGVFSVVTLLLAALGIFGALATMVQQRRRDIGIQLALGQSVAQARAAVLRQGMQLTGWGLLLGGAGSLAGSRILRRMLFGVEPTDPVTLAAVAILVVVTAAIACWIPARRITHLDPLVALRAE